MSIRNRGCGGLLLLLVLFGLLFPGFSQVDIRLPSTRPTYSGNVIDFGPVRVGTTKTVTYTFKILESSETAGTVIQIAFSGGHLSSGPFTLKNLPPLPVTIPPGGSITFNVTFTPTAATSYTSSFTIVAQGGKPLQVKQQVVTLTGQGIEAEQGIKTEPITKISGDLNTLRSQIDALVAEANTLEQKLDNLAALIGQWTVGKEQPFHVAPGTTAQNPPPPTEGIAPGIDDIQKRLDTVLETLSVQPDSQVELPPVTVTPDAGNRFRNFMSLADKLLISTAQDLTAIKPEDDYTKKLLHDYSEFILAGRAEISQLIGLSQELPPQTQAYLDYVVVDGASELLYDITSGKSPSPKAQVQHDSGGNEVVGTVLKKAGDIINAALGAAERPVMGALFSSVLNDLAKLFEGNSDVVKILSGMSLAQLELELKLDAIVRGLFGVDINETMNEANLREKLKNVVLGDIPKRLDELKGKLDNLARELGTTLRGTEYTIEPRTSAPAYTGPDYNRSSLVDQVALLKYKLDKLAELLGLALYGAKDLPNGFDIEPPPPPKRTVLSEKEPEPSGPTLDPIKPEIREIENQVKLIKKLLEELLNRLGGAEGTYPQPPQPPPPDEELLALTKKIYVYDEGTFTASAAGDYKEINVTTAAFDLAGWIDLTELRDGDAVTVTVEVSVGGGPFRTWSTTTFSDRQARGLKYFTEFASGLPQVVGTNVRVTIAQGASADDFATPIPIYYQFIVESQD